mmetsp:Transcript_9678/g.24654  ORF Transcript_9678/g.24654 Transcript_9678/m.24654 type:complete len:620 (-) Transcript_9678:400-2259(-)|eukprot:jgi/Tetstr1/447606/TSEL_034967.t1
MAGASTSKRRRLQPGTAANAGDPALCQVQGCAVDLWPEGERAVRYKTCGFHQRCDSVPLRGQEFRFCQQCTRMHTLDRFDGAKRGCRQKLSRHNFRRKQKTVYKNIEKGLDAPPASQGAGVGIASSVDRDEPEPQPGAEPATPSKRSKASAGADAEAEPAVTSSAPSESVASPSEPAPASDGDPMDDDSAKLRLDDDDRLDILPDDELPSEMEEMVAQLPASIMPACTIQATDSMPGPFNMPMTMESLPPRGGNAGPHTKHNMPSLLPPRPRSADGLPPRPASGQPRARAQSTLDAGRTHGSASRDMGLHPDSLFAATLDRWETAQEVDHRDLHVRLPFAASRTLAAFPSEYHALAHRTWSRLDEARPLHITMKMAGATPACLPHNMRSALGSILEMLPEGIQGAMRPGCLHVSLDFWMRSAADYDAALAAFHRHLRSPPPGSQLPWLTHNTWLYLPDSEVQMKNGQIACVAPRASCPTVSAVEPCVAAGAGCMQLRVGRLAPGRPFQLLCRLNGHYTELTVLKEQRTGDGEGSLVTVRGLPDAGLAWLEAVQERPRSDGGMALSKPAPVLVTTSSRVLRELRRARDLARSASFLNARPAQPSAQPAQPKSAVCHQPPW